MDGFDQGLKAAAGRASRRRFVVRVAAAAGAALAGAAAPLLAGAHPGATTARRASRARYTISRDYAAPVDSQVIVPWAETVFQFGSDVALEADGKVRIDTPGLYEVVFSSDWEATADTDIGLRQIGIRRQKLGQSADPKGHERLGFVNVPASDPPRMARYKDQWQPGLIRPGSGVFTDVRVTPAGVVLPGDIAQAAHTQIRSPELTDQQINALIVQARVIAADTVRVTLHNASTNVHIEIPQGALRVLAMNASQHTGTSEDTWQVLHSPSTELIAGDRVYAQIQHKVEGTLFQATRSSYFQIDRLE